MYKIDKFTDHSLTMYRLTEPSTNTFLTICPERGGIITAFHVNGEDIFYLDHSTLYDKAKNVRGGNPVLFPVAGQLTDGKYTLNGREYEMPNHGLARQANWIVTDAEENEEKAFITLQFVSSKETYIYFPFDFKVELTYILKDGKVSICQHYHNLSTEVMPIYPGFHPYFHIAQQKIECTSNASKYLDYNDNNFYSFNGTMDMNGKAEAVVLVDSNETRLTTTFNDKFNLIIEKDPVFSYTVLWVQEGKDFFCIEPWTAKKDEFNKKEELIYVKPNENFEASLCFSLEQKK